MQSHFYTNILKKLKICSLNSLFAKFIPRSYGEVNAIRIARKDYSNDLLSLIPSLKDLKTLDSTFTIYKTFFPYTTILVITVTAPIAYPAYPKVNASNPKNTPPKKISLISPRNNPEPKRQPLPAKGIGLKSNNKQTRSCLNR